MDFKESLKLERYMKQYEMVTDVDYFNFTSKFFYDVCVALEKNFPGVDTENKTRIKGKNSYKKKASQDKDIYDIYGSKTVILHVKDNVPESLGVSAFLKRREIAHQNLEEAILSHKQAKENDPNYKIRKEDLALIEKIRREQYETANDICEIKIAEKMFEFLSTLPNDPYFKKNYGLYHIADRDRDYNTSDEYIARHITFGSTKFPLWYLEWQTKSLHSYNLARTGPASHDHRDGKQIVFPDSVEDLSEDDLAHYIYFSGKNQNLYIAGMFENTFHKFQPKFSEHPDFSKEIVDKLSDKTGYNLDPRDL